MKPKTKSELMAEWASQPDQLKREREVKAVRKAMVSAVLAFLTVGTFEEGTI